MRGLAVLGCADAAFMYFAEADVSRFWLLATWLILSRRTEDDAIARAERERKEFDAANGTPDTAVDKIR